MYCNLSLTDGIPVAYIKGGDYDGYQVGIKKSDIKDNELQSFFLGNNKGIMKPIYHTQLENAPNRYLISGISGSGKSYQSRNIAESYLELFPNNKVIIFTGKPRIEDDIFVCPKCRKYLINKDPDDEKVIERLKKCKLCNKFKRFKLDESLLEDPVDIAILKNSLVIFDDIETRLFNKDIIREVERIRNSIIHAGRSANIAILTINQNMLQGSKTTTPNTCSFNITGFPKSGSYQFVEYLERYLHIPKKIIKNIIDLPTRWVSINTCIPTYVLFEKGIFLM
jgi:hypothetical protein